MKKIINITILLALTFAFFTTGCKKEEIIESVITDSSSEQDLNSPTNPSINNPFDKNHEYIEKMFQDIADFISTIEKNPDYEDFEKYINDFENLIEPYQRNSPYPKFDISMYNNEEQEEIEELMASYMSNIETLGLEEATKEIEKDISLMSDYALQQSLFSIVSQAKFTFDIIESILPPLTKPWYKFKQCMDDHYDNMNWVDWLEFYTNPPGYVAWTAGSCAWEALK